MMIRLPVLTLRRSFAAAALMIAGAVLFAFLSSRAPSAPETLDQTLARWGFETPQVAARKQGGRNYIFSNIALDPDGFSTVEKITLEKNSIFGGGIGRMTVDNMSLIGDFSGDGALDIAGWNRSALQALFPPVRHFELKNSEIGLNTPAGIISLSAGVLAEARSNGGLDFTGTLAGAQKQLTMAAKWTGQVAEDGQWSAGAALEEARFDLEPQALAGSRISGWLSFAGRQGALPDIGGQLAIGYLKKGPLKITNATATIDGRPDNLHLIFNGYSGAYKNMPILLEYRGGAEKSLNVLVESQNVHDILSLLHDTHESLGMTAQGQETLMPLMITAGNLARLAKQISAMTYDGLELQINGTLHDLSGRIVVKRTREGTVERSVISLDPGLPPT